MLRQRLRPSRQTGHWILIDNFSVGRGPGPIAKVDRANQMSDLPTSGAQSVNTGAYGGTS
jgi:hypothetical protein